MIVQLWATFQKAKQKLICNNILKVYTNKPKKNLMSRIKFNKYMLYNEKLIQMLGLRERMEGAIIPSSWTPTWTAGHA